MNNNVASASTIPNILIVDDVSTNLKILGAILKDSGYKVRPVPHGMLALQAAEREKPDLILLDIMMPDIDGYEVCRRLKENSKLCDVPIIFISALSDPDDIVRALNAGGVDYITKPFRAEEVKARVATHLKLYKQSEELQELNATKDKFFSIIAHDLRGPLSGLIGLAELMTDETQQFEPDEKKDLMYDLRNSARNIYNLLENLLEWSQMQRQQISFTPRILSLYEIVPDVLKIVTELARKKAIEIIVDIPSDEKVFADTNMLQTIIRNLLTNAIKFTPQNGQITISTSHIEDKSVLFMVKDSGIGMNIEMIENLFKLDAKNSRVGLDGEMGTGLGLLLSKEFVEKNGGKLWVESKEGNGSAFYFTIPQ
ncbi:MAG: hybrid sensor histidine kinase/response regulator [Bacteroidetes bacterium]|nr:hybrid sensor histidine kinase/response regulator [Bacteroidota bacterium]